MAAVFFGCAQIPLTNIRDRNAANLQMLEAGMSKADVQQIMGGGEETVVEKVFYQSYLSGYREIEVSNPYKSEVKRVQDKSYEILYYYADHFGMGMGYWDRSYIEKRVPDYILTPLVFENERLIGWGREFAREKDLIDEEPYDPNNAMLWGR